MKSYRKPAQRQPDLPHSDEAECAALGCVLAQTENEQPADAGRMLEQLRQSDFHDLRYREIFSALRCLHLDGKPLDEINLNQWLKDKGKLDNAGGATCLASLRGCAPPTAFNSYLATLRNKAARRELLSVSADVERLARDETQDPAALVKQLTELTERIMQNGYARREWLHFYTPSQCRDYIPPKDHVLAGDCHLVRGAASVCAGPPGVGKSRSGLALAVAGANGLGACWMGLPIRCQFKTVIIQAENGRFRLKKEFDEITGNNLDDFIRICEPPNYGMAFGDPEFCAYLSEYLREVQPGLVVLDPWNSVAEDDGQRDYFAALSALRGVLPKGEAAPHMMINAHTRKPRGDERKSGRGLLHDVAGHHVLTSFPRSVFVMLPASDDPQDERVVWTCCKNNDGELGERSAWYRRNGLFEPCQDFDWEAFDGHAEKRRALTLQDLETLFQGGARRLAKPAAVTELMELTKLGKTACYDALKPDGKFGANLSECSGLIEFKS